MLPCNSCYICGTWSNKKVRSLKSSYGGKEKIRKEGEFSWGGGRGAVFFINLQVITG